MNRKLGRLGITIFLVALCSGACTCSTEYGDCIGAFDDGDPNLVYRTSGWNVLVAIGCVHTVVVPAYVIATAVKCPRDVRTKGLGR